MAYSGGGDFDHDPSITSTEELLASLELNSSLSDPNILGLGHGVGQGNLGLDANPSDWNYSTNDYSGNYNSQLLPPLRRPDLNQLPADVLGLLLKSERFNELLGDRNPGAPRVDMSSRSGGPFQEGTGNSNSGAMHNRTPYQRTSKPFVPSPMAKEFVPRASRPQNYQTQSFGSNFSTPGPQQSQPQYGVDPTCMLAMAVAQVNLENQQHNASPRSRYTSDKGADAASVDSAYDSPGPLGFMDQVMFSVTDTIVHLTSNPGEFGASSKKLLNLLTSAVPSKGENVSQLLASEMVGVIMTLIIEQSITQRNFSYTGARLCDLLNEHKIGGKNLVQTELLTRVQEIFSNCLQQLDSGAGRLDASGVLYFLAELYKSFRMNNNKSFFGFGVASLELMQKLLKLGGHENIKLVSNVLKLIGYDLDVHENPIIKKNMQDLMKDLSNLQSVESIITPETKSIVTNILELRKCNWGREPASSSSEENSDDGCSEPNTTVFYELPDSEEETFDIDDEPDIVGKCYEEFLMGVPSKKK